MASCNGMAESYLTFQQCASRIMKLFYDGMDWLTIKKKIIRSLKEIVRLQNGGFEPR